MYGNQNTPERPHCFGLGRDLDSRQWVPIERCQSCPFVDSCSRLRLAQGVEALVAQGRGEHDWRW